MSDAARIRREWDAGDSITCPRCEGQKYDRGSCGLCGNLGALGANGERFHCDCRADDWVEGDNGAIRCEQCGGYAGEPGTSIRLVAIDASPEGASPDRPSLVADRDAEEPGDGS